jgi:hypothetical protein
MKQGLIFPRKSWLNNLSTFSREDHDADERVLDLLRHAGKTAIIPPKKTAKSSAITTKTFMWLVT